MIWHAAMEAYYFRNLTVNFITTLLDSHIIWFFAANYCNISVLFSFASSS